MGRPQPNRKQDEIDPQVPQPPNKQQHVNQPGCVAANLARGTLPSLAVLFKLYSVVGLQGVCCVAASGRHTVAVAKDGKAHGWGDGTDDCWACS